MPTANPSKQLVIGEIYAYVMQDVDGNEGVPAFSTPDLANPGFTMMIPCVGSDFDRLKSLLPQVRAIAARVGRPFKLYKFSNRTDVTELIG